jgi:DNA-binding transcriptional LysR family regulator
MTSLIDFEGINQAAVRDYRRFLQEILPGGKFRGPEYIVKNPKRNDQHEGSFKINIRGPWADFAARERSTRKLTLTDAGERFFDAIRANLEELQASIASVASPQGQPSGVLKVSAGPTFGIEHILPLLPDFLRRYPDIRIDWSFEHRPVDLIGEVFDAAIGSGFELPQDVVARVLAPHHLIAVASPTYLRKRTPPVVPSDLASFNGILMRSSRTRKVRKRPMRNAAGQEMDVPLKPTIMFDDPQAMRQAAVLGLGVTQIIVADALRDLESGVLVRLLPEWYVDAGAISIYHSSRALMPAKTRVFIDFIVDSFRRNRLSERFAAIPCPRALTR